MRKFLFLFSASILTIGIINNNYANGQKIKETDMKILVTINNKKFTATMYDNPTARDFISLLPLTLKLEDYAGTEKISNLPRKLSLKDAPSGCDPSVGDITYYSPWGNLAVFYRDYNYARGLILLGKIDSSNKFFKECRDSCTIKIEKIPGDN